MGGRLRTAIGRNSPGSYQDRPLIRWLRKGFWAVADQGLFATSNFVLNILLARWLSPQDYGAFAAMFAVFLLLGALHTGLLTEPMLVFGSGRYKNRRSEYLGTLLGGHLGFAVLSGLLLLLASLGLALAGSSALSKVLLALTLAGPFILLLWMIRRACYIRLEPHLAASGGALYMVLMLAGAYALYLLEWLTAASALGVMGFSSLVVSLWLAVRLRIKRPPHFRRDKLPYAALVDHWRYGRWSVATQALTWAPGNIYFLLLPLWGGLEASASLKALSNFVMPASMAIAALSTLLLPSLTQARGEARFGTLVRYNTVLFVLGSLVYWLFLSLFDDSLVAWLYGGQYREDAQLLWILGLIPLAISVSSVLGAALRAFERPDQVFWAYAFSTILGLTLGVTLMIAWGVVGAAVGLVAYSAATAGAMAYLFSGLGATSTEVGRKHT
jgi:O-antigen/teichoic acid export membrane protein